jgi:hypothetical protein
VALPCDSLFSRSFVTFLLKPSLCVCTFHSGFVPNSAQSGSFASKAQPECCVTHPQCAHHPCYWTLTQQPRGLRRPHLLLPLHGLLARLRHTRRLDHRCRSPWPVGLRWPQPWRRLLPLPLPRLFPPRWLRHHRVDSWLLRRRVRPRPHRRAWPPLWVWMWAQHHPPARLAPRHRLSPKLRVRNANGSRDRPERARNSFPRVWGSRTLPFAFKSCLLVFFCMSFDRSS